MSLCFRTIPNKLAPFVNTRKRLTKIVRPLSKHVKLSTFLEKFLGTNKSVIMAANRINKRCEMSIASGRCQNKIAMPIDTINQSTDLLTKKYNLNNEENIWSNEHSQFQLTCLSMQSAIEAKILDHLSTYELIPNKSIHNSIIITQNNFSKSSMNKSIDGNNILLINKRPYGTKVEQDIKNQPDTVTEMTHPQILNDKPSRENEDKPSQEKLQHILDILSQDLPRMFVKTLNYSIYEPNLIMVNNIKGTTSHGIANFIVMITLLRIIAHVKFSSVSFDVIKITAHTEDHSVKVRWRIRGCSAIKGLLMFWKIHRKAFKDIMDEREIWYDGFCTFYVNDNGRVCKLVIDKLMPDQSTYEKPKTPLAKLTLFMALMGLETLQYQAYLLK